MDVLKNWVDGAPVMMLGSVILVLVMLAAAAGVSIRHRHDRDQLRAKDEHADGQEGYLVSAVLGLLALLVGFTFSLAVDRFEIRRGLVLAEANAIGTAYLRTQLLAEPHRTRISDLLIDYAENRVALGKSSAAERPKELAKNDQLVTELWSTTASAFETIKRLDFSSAYLDSVNAVIVLDSSRKAARTVHVPTEVFVVLVIYLIVTAGVLGYVFRGARGRGTAVFLLLLLSMALLLIIEIDRPTQGGIRESQRPMEALVQSLKATPREAYDHWRLKDLKQVSTSAQVSQELPRSDATR